MKKKLRILMMLQVMYMLLYQWQCMKYKMKYMIMKTLYLPSQELREAILHGVQRSILYVKYQENNPTKIDHIMKEYKYKINGNLYKVTIGEIEDNVATVEVNGTPYKVEMEKAPKQQVTKVERPVPVTPQAPTATVAKPAQKSNNGAAVIMRPAHIAL